MNVLLVPLSSHSTHLMCCSEQTNKNCLRVRRSQHINTLISCLIPVKCLTNVYLNEDLQLKTIKNSWNALQWVFVISAAVALDSKNVQTFNFIRIVAICRIWFCLASWLAGWVFVCRVILIPSNRMPINWLYFKLFMGQLLRIWFEWPFIPWKLTILIDKENSKRIKYSHSSFIDARS